MQVPWAEPVLGEEEIQAVVETLRSGWVGMGPRVKQFEASLASYVGVEHAIAVNNGTSALDICLKALGIGRDDEVIMPAMGYIAGAFAISQNAARLALADIDPRTFNIDPNDVERRITPRTRAIMAIDYGGQVCDYDALMAIARRHDLFVIEDAAGALGGSWRGQMAGSFGHMAITSFHVAKVMTTIEGGMVFTHDAELARRARIIRNQGEDPAQKYRHVMVGNNFRMTDISAAIGLVQFGRLPALLASRKRQCERYNAGFADLGDLIQLPHVEPDREHGWFFYPILVHDRDEVAARLKAHGVDYRIAWPIPLHQQPAYAAGFPAGTRYPVAEDVASRLLTLPLFHAMTDEQQDYVIDTVRAAVGAAPLATASVR